MGGWKCTATGAGTYSPVLHGCEVAQMVSDTADAASLMTSAAVHFRGCMHSVWVCCSLDWKVFAGQALHVLLRSSRYCPAPQTFFVVVVLDVVVCVVAVVVVVVVVVWVLVVVTVVPVTVVEVEVHPCIPLQTSASSTSHSLTSHDS